MVTDLLGVAGVIVSVPVLVVVGPAVKLVLPATIAGTPGTNPLKTMASAFIVTVEPDPVV